MERVFASFLPPIALDSSRKIPIYRQLYEWFRRAILAGELGPGQRVPSTRSLAAELKVSRIPVSSAYEQLLAEGYFETFVGAGTCVARSIPDDALKPVIGKILGASRQVSTSKARRKVSRRVALMRVPAQTWSNKLVAFRVACAGFGFSSFLSAASPSTSIAQRIWQPSRCDTYQKQKARHRSSGLILSRRVLCRFVLSCSDLHPPCPLSRRDLPAG